jgi:hypothetical protein
MKLFKFHILHIFLLAIVVSFGIFIYTLAIPAGTISLAQNSTSDFHIVSVKAENLRYPFFGTAFHLHYDPNDYSYDHFTLGDYFTSQDSPLVLIHEGREYGDRGELIAGISLKRGKVINKPDGTLLKFYFKPISNDSGNQNFTFSHEVFSTFDKERKDLTNINFSD